MKLNERGFRHHGARATIPHVNAQVKTAGRIAVCALNVAIMTAVFKRVVHANATTVVLTFLLAVLVVSANWGFWYAAFLAIVSTAAFNFYFLPPLGTFTIADPQNWIALCAFLVVAVIASKLSAAPRHPRREGRARRN